MPNFDTPGRDFPSREDIREMERRDRDRDKEQERVQRKVDAYLERHPSSSYAEALYKTGES